MTRKFKIFSSLFSRICAIYKQGEGQIFSFFIRCSYLTPFERLISKLIFLILLRSNDYCTSFTVFVYLSSSDVLGTCSLSAKLKVVVREFVYYYL